MMELDYLDSINMSVLDADASEQDKLLFTLAKVKQARNIISLDEFNSKYRILFANDDTVPRSELETISVEYFGKIDPYQTVYIVNNIKQTIDESLQKDNIVYILPPIFTRIDPINSLGTDSVNMLQAFNNVNTGMITDTFDKKKEKYAAALTDIIERSGNTKLAEYNRNILQQVAPPATSSPQVQTNSSTELPQEMLDEINKSKAITKRKSKSAVEEEFL